MIAIDQEFSDIRVFLDGCTFIRCTFRKCTIVYAGHLGMVLNQPKFIECKWEMAGHAKDTLAFLSVLYAGGAADLVEATFDNIRGKPRSGKPTLS